MDELVRKSAVEIVALLRAGEITIAATLDALYDGADGFVKKPFDIQKLMGHIEELLQL